MCGRRDESLVLDDLVQAATRLVVVTRSRDATPLGDDRDVDEVVLWNLTVLGEASKRLSAQTRERFPEMPWRELARTRDLVVHHYEGVDWPLIEQICRLDVPALLPRLKAIRDLLRQEFDAEWPT